MARKQITYGDMAHLLQQEGFERKPLEGPHVFFEKATARASLVLPDQKPGAAAMPIHIAMLRRTMIDFGIMTEADFEKWASDPSQFLAA